VHQVGFTVLFWITSLPSLSLSRNKTILSVTQLSTTRLNHVLETGHLCLCLVFLLTECMLGFHSCCMCFVFTIFISSDVYLSCCSRCNTWTKAVSALTYAFTSSRVTSWCYVILLLFISLTRNVTLSGSHLRHRLTIRKMPAAIVAPEPRTVFSESLLQITRSPSGTKWIIAVSHNSFVYSRV
jgi:hypothetical protein